MDAIRMLRCQSGFRLGLLLAAVVAVAAADANGAAPAVNPPMVNVSSADIQPSGPTYSYRVGRYEITNGEYATFLNDTLLHFGDEKGAYVYHDVPSGLVLLHNLSTGGIGSNGAGTLAFDATIGQAIQFVATNGSMPFVGSYVVTDGLESSPVTGVTWYGAVKFCNWLTLHHSLGAAERAYLEGSTAASWRPATISAAAWATRDLNATERNALTNLVGYRLPMDNQTQTASAYNEWYKVGAFIPIGAVHRNYGFGRDVRTAADANYLNSTDPFDNGVSPVGFFDGVNLLAGGAPTAINQNGYGAYDISGNVWEWMQDRLPSNVGRIRGGGWTNSASSSLRVDQWLPNDLDLASDDLGFRVVQSMRNAFTVTPAAATINLSGPCGGPYVGEPVTVNMTNRTIAPVGYDFASDQPWLLVGGQASQSGSFLIADANSDGFVDLIDYSMFAECFAGPDAAPPPALPLTPAVCTNTFDFDDDGDVDSRDASVFQRAAFSISGSRTISHALSFGPCSALALGQNSGTVSARVDALGIAAIKTINLNVSEPMSVSPTDELDAAGPVGGPFVPGEIVYQIQNASASPFDAIATADQSWAELAWRHPGSTSVIGTNGAIVSVGGGGLELRVSADPADPALIGGPHFAIVTITNTDTGTQVTRNVTVTVAVGLAVTPPVDESIDGRCPGTYVPVSLVYIVANPSAVQISMAATTNMPDWLDLSPAAALIAPQGSIPVTVTPKFLAAPAVLLPGEYQALVQFADAATPAITIDHAIDISVLDQLALTPSADLEGQGSVGGPFAPDASAYLLSNHGATTDYVANVEYDQPQTPWVSLTVGGFETVCEDGAVCADGTLPANPGFSTAIDVRVLDAANQFAAGSYGATLRIQSAADAAGCSIVTRRIELTVLNVEQEPLLPDMVLVEGDDGGGLHPTHDFQFGRTEITNAEYARFLTSAMQSPNDARGQYMFFDRDSGSVYVNDAAAGQVGSNGFVGSSGFAAILFDAAIARRVHFAQNEYVASSGFEDHPVVGLSWFGAVKYCNWLSVSLGIDPANTVYNEGPAVVDWSPRFSASAIAGGATPAFRLPMDGGASGAAALNEWFKAASLINTNGASALFGFGRDIINSNDANYKTSSDPFEASVIAVSPVGYYDGVNLLTGGGTTDSTSNAYALEDMAGNVAEWMHGSGSAGRTRGGSWRNVAASLALRCNTATVELPEAPRDYIGFRIAQTLVGDTIDITPADDIAIDGVEGGPIDLIGGAFLDPTDPTYWMSIGTNGTPRSFHVSVDANWLNVNSSGSLHGLLTPDVGTASFAVSISSNALAVLSPLGDEGSTWADISIASQQPQGPAYSFRVARFEVTNREYAAFLNAAIASPSAAPGQYLFHDTDSGDVFLHDQQTGATGTDGDGVLMFRASDGGRITYDDALGEYVVQGGYERHPVVGVSWLGAVKFCNYLTIASGLSTADRAYTEGPNIGDWRPVTIALADWWGTTDTSSNALPQAGAREPNDVERWSLVTDVRGYRLLMDGGADAADVFSEWYEAAAWDQSSGVNATYGFGRDDPIDDADANYGGSFGDTTSIGWYNGVNLTSTGAVTRDTSNAFDLYDLSGNVREWVQDREGGDQFRVRGGSFADPAPSIQAGAPAVAMSMGATDRFTGFRVMQAARDTIATITFTDELLDTTEVRTARMFLRRALTWTPDGPLTAAGVWPGPYVPDHWITTIDNGSNHAVDVTVESDATWVTVDVTSASIPAVQSLEITASLDVSTFGPPPGKHMAKLTLTNIQTGTVRQRDVSLTVDEPIFMTPTTDLDVHRFWGQSIVGQIGGYVVSNGITQSLDLHADVDVAWLTFDTTTDGPLPPGDTGDVLLSLNSQADLLNGPADYVATLTIDNLSAGSQLERQINLHLLDPLDIADTNGLVMNGNYGGPFAPIGGKTYAMINRANAPMDWIASVDANWLSVNSEPSDGGALGAGQTTLLTIDVNTNANTLPDGTYVATLTITNLSTPNASVRTRPIALSVSEFLVVTPITGKDVVGPVGGPFAPLQHSYTITNRDAVSISWQADVTPGGLITVDGGDTTGGVLAPSQSATVVIDVNQSQAAQLGAGTTLAPIHFQNLSSGQGDTMRQVAFEVVVPINSVGLAAVDPIVQQPGGPSYPFFISRYEITNHEFAKFLNNALNLLQKPRGAFMYHDTDSGDVYIHSTSNGVIGTAGSGTHMFRSATAGLISFDTTSNAYVVSTGFEQHPVVGVTWYGAVKYCNWLTLDSGMPPSARCYKEAGSANLGRWRPLTIGEADWATRDLNDAERALLVGSYHGYRLPMDDGKNNVNPATDAADNYNEWFAASAWKVIASGAMICPNGLVGLAGFDCINGGVGDPGYLCGGGVAGTGGAVGCNTMFGFGRDVADGRDANYASSGDPFDDDTTPVGFYNGAQLQADGVTLTRANANGFDVYDLSGNVQEWVQDKYSTPLDRTVRGGAFISAPTQTPWINNDGRRKSNPNVATSSLIGFRVVRVDATSGP